MIIYILYKTIRTETGEYYIGIHGIDTDDYPDLNDPYLGSGVRITASVKKHGRKAFKRSILSISESRKVVEALEAAMVTVEMIADPLCLNLAPGGRGGVKGVPNLKLGAALKGTKRSTKTRQAIGDALRGVPKSAEHRQVLRDAQRGIPGPKHSIETRQAISDSQKGVPKSAEHRQALSDAKKGVPKPAISAALKGIPKSPEHCQAISDAQKKRWRHRN